MSAKSPYSVLVVDDVLSELQLIATLLGRHGYRCLQATDGEQALAEALTHRPDLILLDIVMPGRDSFATCRELKACPETRDIPVIMVSSKRSASDRFWAERQGCQGYLCKPFTPEELLGEVQRFCAAAPITAGSIL